MTHFRKQQIHFLPAEAALAAYHSGYFAAHYVKSVMSFTLVGEQRSVVVDDLFKDRNVKAVPKLIATCAGEKFAWPRQNNHGVRRVGPYP